MSRPQRDPATRLAWLRPRSRLPRAQLQEWLDTFGEEAEAVRGDLVPDLVEFLEQARFVYDWEHEVHLSFFYWVQNLASPDFKFEMQKYEQEKEGETRYLVLYAMNNFTGHFYGLM
jgi:hypothetical protein